MEKNEKHRLYEIIAYKEYFPTLINTITKLDKCRYYWCHHDKDLRDDGTIKDEHWHILVYFDNACTLSALMKKINFDKQEKISFWKKGTDEGRLDYRVRYLIHYKSNDTHRHEYSFEDLQSNDTNLERFFDNVDKKEYSDISLIFDYFDNQDEELYLSYRDFLNYIFSNNLWSTYRRNASIFNKLFDEHNVKTINLLKDTMKYR